MSYTESISLKLVNNTSVDQPIGLLGGTSSTYANANNNVLVQWDLSTETFVGNQVTLNTTTPITKDLLGQNISGLVQTLNTMNVATFTFQGTTVYASALLDNSVETANMVIDSNLIDNRIIFSVKTDNSGTSASNQFTIPTTGTGYLYDIETSDGQTITGLTSGTTITFPSAGAYDVFITGSFPRFFFNNVGDKLKLLELKNFGTYAEGSTSQERAFYGCSNLVISATDVGYFGSVTDFGNAWNNCSSLTSFPLIDTSSGTNFDSTWSFCSSLTSFPLIDTSSGTNFGFTWTTCNSLVTFPLIDTSSGTDISYAWVSCSSLTSFPLLNTSSVTNFTNTWFGCSSLTSFPLLNTSSGTNFANTWYGCSSLTSFPLLDTSSGTNFSSTWRNCSSLTSFPLLDTSSVTIFTGAWYNCSSLTSFPLLDTSSAFNFGSAWFGCSSLTSFPLIDTSSGTNFGSAWYNCNSLVTFPANAFDTNIATNYINAFNTTNLSTQSIDDILVSLDVSGVSNGTFLQSGGSTPSATGLNAKANLISKGWTITTT